MIEITSGVGVAYGVVRVDTVMTRSLFDCDYFLQLSEMEE